MAQQTDFAARIARIEHRARTGAKAEFAPLPEDLGPMGAPEGRRPIGRRLMTRVVLPLTALVLGLNAYSENPVLPLPEHLAGIATPISEAVRERLGGTDSAALAPAPQSPGQGGEVLSN